MECIMCMGHCLICSHVVGVGVGLPLLIICIALMWVHCLALIILPRNGKADINQGQLKTKGKTLCGDQ